MNIITDAIQTTIGSLLKEHQQIKKELDLLQSLMEEKNFPSQELLKFLNNLKTLTLSGHHEKEEKILLKWMIDQNPNADGAIISKIKKDHQELDAIVQRILERSEGLEDELTNFLQLYREHIDLEENFIFLIAKGILAASECEYH